MYGVTWSDHFPIQVKCNFGVLPRIITNSQITQNKVTWGIRNQEQIVTYTDLCHMKLRDIDFPPEFKECSDKTCDISEHKVVIDRMYNRIIEVLQEAAVVSHSFVRPKKHRHVTGWNKHVREYHERARLGFHLWVWYGKPKEGLVYDEMCRTRKDFKSKLKWCQDNETQIIMDILATKHESKDFASFWKQTNRLTPKSSYPVNVDGVTDCKGIANIFKEYFKVDPMICDRVNDSQKKNMNIGVTHLRFSANEVKKVIHSLKARKITGIRQFEYRTPEICRCASA